MVRSCSRARVAARSRSWETTTIAWMVAMTATSTKEVGGGVDEGATMSVHVRAGWWAGNVGRTTSVQ
jgi:hypothetical protein